MSSRLGGLEILVYPQLHREFEDSMDRETPSNKNKEKKCEYWQWFHVSELGAWVQRTGRGQV